MLESIANLKSSHVVEVNRRNSFESSFMSSYERVLGDEESKPPLRDPAGGYRDNTQSKPSLFGDQKEFDDNTSVGYSVGSYLPQRPLEPEESVDNVDADDSTERDAAQDRSSQLEPRMTLIKVPGGEYRGQVNENGQKHGRGKMIYGKGTTCIAIPIGVTLPISLFYRKTMEMSTTVLGWQINEMEMAPQSMPLAICMLVRNSCFAAVFCISI